ncbi:DNA-binding response regulator [Flavobacterium arcticum]|uniref:DNA-binding response regulator n=1 Tax=Flavobacterium arcticum TaxID=1784713 RepID=A0A345HE81_9FLAO|nr:LuxR C-terminal-related transcriptional regulator [Flavobacterium arcticum]AXG74891.1 DNA-binding response regulator [Flavobacterium arcticum]KAF2509611.1 DNA-binding response regulator [Flavobacterium arcticum]
MLKAIVKNKRILLYGSSLALLLFLLRWLELRFLILSNAQDIYFGAIALIFTLLGIWIALKIATPKKEVVVVEKTIYIQHQKEFIRNKQALQETNLSQREMDVLELMAQGMSNAEIADKLFVSLNTVKTHSSRVYEKLEVKRRTQAVEKARQLQLIA